MSTGSRLSDRAKTSLSVAIVAVLLAMLVGTAEIAVRVRQAIKYGYAGSLDQVYEVDSRTGLRVPKARARFGPIKINSLGFRGPEIVEPKPVGTIRIAFLGASTTFCAEASSNDAVWPHLVVESLRKRFTDTRFDYVNGGVPGYTVASSTRNLELRVSPLRPDLIVIYHATNDLSGELRGIAARQSGAASIAPPESSWLSRRSLLWNLMTKNLRLMLARSAAESESRVSATVDPEALGTEFRKDLTTLVRAGKAIGARVALVTFSTQLRAGQDAAARRTAMQSAVLYMPGFDFDQLLAAYRRYNAIIREVASGEDVLLIDGEDAIPGDPKHFADSVHFTDAGNTAQAARVTEALASSRHLSMQVERR